MAEGKRPVSEVLSEGALNVRFEDLSERNVAICKDKLLDKVEKRAEA